MRLLSEILKHKTFLVDKDERAFSNVLLHV